MAGCRRPRRQGTASSAPARHSRNPSPAAGAQRVQSARSVVSGPIGARYGMWPAAAGRCAGSHARHGAAPSMTTPASSRPDTKLPGSKRRRAGCCASQQRQQRLCIAQQKDLKTADLRPRPMCRAPCENGHGARCGASGAEQYARSPASCRRGKQRPSAKLVTRQVLRVRAHRPHCCMETGARCRAFAPITDQQRLAVAQADAAWVCRRMHRPRAHTPGSDAVVNKMRMSLRLPHSQPMQAAQHQATSNSAAKAAAGHSGMRTPDTPSTAKSTARSTSSGIMPVSASQPSTASRPVCPAPPETRAEQRKAAARRVAVVQHYFWH